MKSYILSAVLLSHAILNSASAEEKATDGFDSLAEGMAEHCVPCHGKGGRAKGGVNLRELDLRKEIARRPRFAEKLISVLENREMPPVDRSDLDDATRARWITALRRRLSAVLETYPFEPTPIRRMNRFQYNNAVVDLLELDRDVFALNERLMRRRDDYFRPASRKMPQKVRVSCRPLAKDIDNQRPEGFRGVSAFPQDQRAEHGFDNRADHLTLSPLLMESFLRLSQTIAESPDLNSRECRSWSWLFSSPGEAVQASKRAVYEAEESERVRIVTATGGSAASQVLGNRWSGKAHLFWTCPKPGEALTLEFEVPNDSHGTGLLLRMTQARDYGVFEIDLDGKRVGEPIDLYHPKPRLVSRKLDVSELASGRHALRFRCTGKSKQSSGHFLGVDFVRVIGLAPVGGARAEDPTAKTSTRDVLRPRVAKLLRRAFRRPPDAATLDRFVRFAEAEIDSGESFETAMRTLIGAVLGMPGFLYVYEIPNTGESVDDLRGREAIDDFELATRLAFFLWSSLPDDELLELAEAGKLSERETLSQQIDRMLDDRRSGRFCENFPAQWLQLERLVTAIPDRKKFPHFYYHGYRSSLHMMSEPLLLFETIFVEDRSVLELLDPGFSWRSPMLRANYEGHSKAPTEVQVQTFERIPLDDPRQGGVITNLAVLTMTSTPTRTQPITRGAWVNAVIFNDPPEPPPADVPPLPEPDEEEIAKMTIRERLAAHRKRSDCAGCHNKIDPLGFALENYGPTGVWRDKYENGREVDPSGTLFQQHEFATALEFKKLMLHEKRRFLRGFLAHLLSYALGRELGPADSPALDAIAERAVAGEDRMRALLRSIAMSEPFLRKNTKALPEASGGESR